jgi:hypothetical protein
MDECMAPRYAYNHYAQKKNPGPGARVVGTVSQSNKDIIDYVIKEMADTLGEDK